MLKRIKQLLSCSHSNKAIKCILCAPELWDPPENYGDKIDLEVKQNLVQQLLSWKKAYYSGEPEVTDDRYDSTESALRDQCPDHPVLSMVGYDETKHEECMEFLRK